MQNRSVDAIDSFNKSIELKPDFAQAYIALSGVYHADESFEEARKILVRAVSTAPRDARANFLLGDLLWHLNKYDEAKLHFKTAFQLDENLADANYAIAALLILEKKPAEAETIIAETRRDRISKSIGYSRVAGLLNHLDQKRPAMEVLRKAFSVDANNHALLNSLGYVLLELDESIEEAFGLIQRAVNAQPKNGAYLDSLGWAYFKMGKLEEAERYLAEATRYYDSATNHEHLGDVRRRLGRKEQANASWKRALEISQRQSGAPHQRKNRKRLASIDQFVYKLSRSLLRRAPSGSKRQLSTRFC